MIHLNFHNLVELENLHYHAVKNYVVNKMNANDINEIYNNIRQLPLGVTYPADRNINDFSWLRRYILADLKLLDKFVSKYERFLKFKQFKSLYLNKFAKGKDIFVDSDKSYNAYALFRKMDLQVCPYCEDSYLGVYKDGESEKKIGEFDHFYPKDDKKFPALAMCFFNLIPSCSGCNHIKLTKDLGANPYDPNIEKLTFIYPDLPMGVNMDTVKVNACVPLFHAKGRMVVNERTLLLEERYKKHSSIVHRLLKSKQMYSEEKLQEFAKIFSTDKETIRRSIFGKPRSEANGKELHTKMKQDLIQW
jgi:hypothetical protein